VRANRLLPWLAVNFPDSHIIYIVRHPCAVVASQIHSKVSGYNSPDHKYMDYLRAGRLPPIAFIRNEAEEAGFDGDILAKIDEETFTTAGILALMWSMDNVIPLNYQTSEDLDFSGKREQPWLTIRYEEFLSAYSSELQKMEQGLDFEQGTLSNNQFIVENLLPKNPQQQLWKWKDALSVQQVDEIYKIMDWFKINLFNE